MHAISDTIISKYPLKSDTENAIQLFWRFANSTSRATLKYTGQEWTLLESFTHENNNNNKRIEMTLDVEEFTVT